MRLFRFGQNAAPNPTPDAAPDSGEFLNPTHAAPEGVTVVMLVEDEPALRTLYGAALRRAGYYVTEARNGLEALKAVETAGRIDVVVTDLVMPFMSGAELAVQLRKDRPELPFIFVSGYMVDEMVSGNSHLLHKPFGATALLDKVRDVAGPPAAAGATGVD